MEEDGPDGIDPVQGHGGDEGPPAVTLTLGQGPNP